MNPASLPTDNLYKFLALSGVAVCLFAVWFPWGKMGSLRQRLDQMMVEIAALEVDVKYTAQDIDQLPEPTLEEVAMVDAANRKHVRDIAVLRAKTTIVVRLGKELGFILGVSLVVLIVGAVMAYKGFMLWYERLQKHLDAAVQRVDS